MALLSSAEIERVYAKQLANRDAVGASSAAERIRKIRALGDALLKKRKEISEALWSDYRKPAEEVDLSEIYPVLGEVRHASRHLKKWMKPKRVAAPLALLGSRSRIVYEPKGVVLIISPWNFPINLTLGPLVSAIAAGNCATIKPSEMTPVTSACMKRILSGIFDESEVAVIEGDAAVAAELLAKRFDHIFFTGSPNVGKVVMRAAAENLTSVTLELGGKSPVIVDRTADIAEAAKKIAWGKSLNSGQACVAPDYVLVDEAIHDAFVQRLQREIYDVGGDLVNERHTARVKGMLDDAVAAGAKVVTGGRAEARRIEPTIVVDVPADSALLRDEIFGPILPVITFRTREDALRIVNEREKPLVMYVFSRDKEVVERYIRGTRAGGTVVNDTLIHFYQMNLPFGGIGNSGFGKAHGFFGFEAFSNARGILEQPLKVSGISLIYPPYNALKRRVIDFMMRFL
jgi:aldehyde dehydrogenase (NAD+)